MPSADGKIRGISVPSVPWHQPKPALHRLIDREISVDAYVQDLEDRAADLRRPAPKPQGKP